MNITLNTPLIDWITATSYDYHFYTHWSSQLENMGKEANEAKLMQYLGVHKSTPLGDCRLMIGRQRDREHYLLHLTGGLAHVMKDTVMAQFSQGNVNITRLDLQITVRKPEKWSQFAFLAAMEKKFNTGWVASVDRNGNKLETVYVGRRTSDRYKRIYTKMSDEGPLLRFEVEFKGPRAKAAMRHIKKSQSALSQILLHEVQTLKSPKAEAVFAAAIASTEPLRVKVVKRTDVQRTNDWLTQQCLPVLIRQCADHDATGDLWRLFYNQLLRSGIYLGHLQEEG